MRDYFVHTIKVDIEKVKARIRDSINKVESGCWEWNRHMSTNGYGVYKVMGETLAHRVSYIIHNEESSQDMCVLHSCDNPPCVNPDHLSLGTRDDNNKDRAAKGRTVSFNASKTHCKRGHEFTEDNTYIRKNGNRFCKACESVRLTKAYHDRRVAEGKRYKNKTHCKHGHEFNEENTYLMKTGARVCKRCERERHPRIKK